MSRSFYYHIGLSGFFGLFILLMLWPTLLMSPERYPVALILLLTVTPLLMPLRGLLQKNLKSCTWMSYLSLIYFIHGTTESYAMPSGYHYALLEVLFSLMLCLGCGMYVYRAEKITRD